MALTRHKHWQTRAYHDFLAASMSKPFAWGVWDCCLFCADGIKAQTGTDIANDFRDRYHDEASAFALVRSLTGGSTVADAAAYCAAKHGMTELEHPLTAQRGDMVVIDNAGRLIAGLVHLSGAHVVTVSETGLVRFPITQIKHAWRVA